MLRIISGQWRHRLLKMPPSSLTRPSTSRMREALFNILVHTYEIDFQGLIVADLYAGSGALGLEALSRGAAKTYFIDNHPAALAVIATNIQTLQAENKAHVLKAKIPPLPAPPEALDLIFLDPPYFQNLVAPTCKELYHQGWLHENTLVCIETSIQDKVEVLSGLQMDQHRTYGQSVISFWRPL